MITTRMPLNVSPRPSASRSRGTTTVRAEWSRTVEGDRLHPVLRGQPRGGRHASGHRLADLPGDPAPTGPLEPGLVQTVRHGFLGPLGRPERRQGVPEQLRGVPVVEDQLEVLPCRDHHRLVAAVEIAVVVGRDADDRRCRRQGQGSFGLHRPSLALHRPWMRFCTAATACNRLATTPIRTGTIGRLTGSAAAGRLSPVIRAIRREPHPRRLPAAFALAAVAAIAIAAAAAARPLRPSRAPTTSSPPRSSPPRAPRASTPTPRSTATSRATSWGPGRRSRSTWPAPPPRPTWTSPTRPIHASFAVPALLGLSGDLIVVDQKAYVKTSLTGPHVHGQRREGD